jgi:hypothetical protein
MIEMANQQFKNSFPLLDDNEFGYRRFSLRQSGMEAFYYLDDLGVDAIMHEGYFIVHNATMQKEYLSVISAEHGFTLNKSTCKFINCELLNKHQLSIGCCVATINPAHANHEYLNYFVNFKNKALDAQLYWTTEFLNSIYSHLKNRQSAKNALINKEIIQAMLADALLHIESAKRHREYTEKTGEYDLADNQLLAIKELKAANQILAKLYGGRSFLAGNVVEMIMIFEYFRDIYF